MKLESLKRSGRDVKLAKTDWTQLPNAPISNAAEWETYRQALRDMPQQPDWPHTAWPTQPSGGS